jgi:hypothetical protein
MERRALGNAWLAIRADSAEMVGEAWQRLFARPVLREATTYGAASDRLELGRALEAGDAALILAPENGWVLVETDLRWAVPLSAALATKVYGFYVTWEEQRFLVATHGELVREHHECQAEDIFVDSGEPLAEEPRDRYGFDEVGQLALEISTDPSATRDAPVICYRAR